MSRQRGQGPIPRAAWLAAAALVVAVCVVFGQARSFGFVDYDDREYVYANAHLREGALGARVRWAFTTFHAANWHPVTWLSFIADAELLGLEPGPLHAENVALHAVNAVLVFALLSRLTGAVGKSALVAALFALHPLRAESVAWVTERKGLLMALFSLATLHAHVSVARRPSPWRAAAVVGFFAAALLAKPQAVALPLLLLALDWWPLGRLGRGAPSPSPAPVARAVLEKAPLLLLAAAGAVATLAAQRRAGTVASLDELDAGARLANAVTAPVLYVAKTAWPAGLSPVYPLVRHPAWLVAAGILLLALAAVAAVRWQRTDPWLIAGGLGFLGLLAPVSGVLQAGGQALADRYTYLPHVPLLTLLVWSGERLSRGRPRLGAAGLAAALLACGALGVAAHRQAAVWRDDRTLFSHAAAAVPGNWKMRYNLANALERDGLPEEAERQYRLALEARPNYPEALNNLGALLGRRGDRAAAAALFARAIAVAPGYGPAWFNLGLHREQAGDTAGALEAYGRSAALQPGAAEPRARLGTLLVRLGWVDEGRAACREALNIDPASAVAATCVATGR